MGNAPTGYLSIQDAADKLGISPWDVMELIEDQRIESVTLVDAASLTRYQEAS